LPAGGPAITRCGDAVAYLEREGLEDALTVILRCVEERVVCRAIAVMLVEYDDWSEQKLVKLDIDCGLHGMAAVAKEDELLDAAIETLGTEKANGFLITVR
jgi:hypothetical protein